MKRRTVFLAIAASLLTSMVSSAHAQTTLRLINQIDEIIPAQAIVGQTLTVKINNTESHIAEFLKRDYVNIKLQEILRRFAGRFTITQTKKIFFSRAGVNSFVEGLNLVQVNTDTFTVQVPQGARSGPMKLQIGGASSMSIPDFTLATTGFTFGNLSQFNVVSLKIDDVERLTPGQVIGAVPITEPNVNVLDVGTTAGNHNIQVVMGLDASRPIMVLFFGSRTAQASAGPNQGFRNPIALNQMLAGEYLSSSPNVVSSSGTSRTVSWQGIQVQPDNVLVVHGFDFTYNSSTNVTTFKHWIGDRPNVDAQGTVTEPTPAQWGVNFPAVNLPLRRSNGSLYTTIQVNLVAGTLSATDGLRYELQ